MRTSLLLTLGAAVALGAAPAQAARAPRRPLSFLHVGSSGGPAALPQVLDRQGRERKEQWARWGRGDSLTRTGGR